MSRGKVAALAVVGCLVVSLAGCGPRRSPASVEYNASEPAKGVTQFPLLTGGNGWQLSGELPQAPGEYSVQLWGDNWAARGTAFTSSDLKLLKPGLIRHQAATPGTAVGPDPDDKISTLEQFSTPACD